MSIKFIILGCGSSLGIPRIDGNFGNCDPKNKKNYRTRCSALISFQQKNILIETDSPFLAPIPMRGKKNEPSFIKYTLEKLSELKSKTFDELETITNDNFERLFFEKWV